MGERVYSKTKEHRDGIADLDEFHSRMPSDTKITVWADHNKVCIAESTMIVGVPRGEAHKDKRYYKWITTMSTGFRRNRAGNPQPYYAYRSWDATRATPWRHASADKAFALLGDTSSELGEVYTHHMRRTFGAGSLYELYPIAGIYGVRSYRNIPFVLRPAMKQDTMNGFITTAFGKTRTTSRLITAALTSDPYFVSYAHQFRGLVPNSLIESFLENQKFDDEMEESFEMHNPNIRKFLMAMNEASRVAILGRGIDLSDCFRIRNLSVNDRYKLRLIKNDKLYTSWSEIMT